MKIIGIDPSLTQTGYAVIENLSYVVSGVIKTYPSQKIEDRLRNIYDTLHAVMQQHKPDLVCLEEVFVNKNGQSTLKLAMARGITLLIPAMFNTPVREYSPNTIKKAVFGHGHTDKEQIQVMLRLCIKNCPHTLNLNESDALAAAFCAHH
jgi:crossover junction endodeoxyribonuclease RuvC